MPCRVTHSSQETYVARNWLKEFETDHERMLCMMPGMNSFAAQICLFACDLDYLICHLMDDLALMSKVGRFLSKVV